MRKVSFLFIYCILFTNIAFAQVTQRPLGDYSSTTVKCVHNQIFQRERIVASATAEYVSSTNYARGIRVCQFLGKASTTAISMYSELTADKCPQNGNGLWEIGWNGVPATGQSYVDRRRNDIKNEWKIYNSSIKGFRKIYEKKVKDAWKNSLDGMSACSVNRSKDEKGDANDDLLGSLIGIWEKFLGK